MLPRILAISALATAACFGQPPVISLERPAAVGLPVWLKIPASNRVETFYPFGLGLPADFGCKQVEVRRNGQILPKVANLADQGESSGITAIFGNPCCSALHDLIVDPARATHPARLPLHLRYRFDKPGVYEVRYAATTEQFTFPHAPAVWSAWTPIEIEAGSPESRASWLAEMSTHAPTDKVEALTDFLPSILGIPDPESLRLLGPYLYHPDELVRRYAGSALTYWPAAQAEATVKEWLRTKGPSDGMIHYLARGSMHALPDFDSILEIVLPYLRSDSPVLVAGALTALWHLTGAASKASPELRWRAEEELMDARDHIRAVGDSGTVSELDSLLEVLPHLR
ncbi:MAG: hypothetical protein ABSF25_00545 [Bryobacteraceae bacterium]|jgi:hypothetical protein